MYDNGQGVPQDHAQALAWYLKAADQGDAGAQTNLGVMYGYGRGVPQDYVQAYMWFSLAASRADLAAIRDTAIKNRDALAAKMTPSQIAEAQQRARERKVSRATTVSDAQPQPAIAPAKPYAPSVGGVVTAPKIIDPQTGSVDVGATAVVAKFGCPYVRTMDTGAICKTVFAEHPGDTEAGARDCYSIILAVAACKSP
jgi:TPR repeat protein